MHLPFDEQVARLALAWAGAIICFMAGVRRGLSFDTRSGPAAAELASMLLLFVAGFASLVCTPAWPAFACGDLMAAYALVGVFDAQAARAGQASRFFGHLRPAQAALFMPCLLEPLTTFR